MNEFGSTAQFDQAHPPRDAQREQLFDHAFSVSEFAEGERLPVGGTNVFDKEKLDISLIIDAQPFQEFFRSVDAKAKTYKLDQLKAWLEQNKATVSTELFAALQAFTTRFREQFRGNDPEKSAKRSQLYHAEGEATTLSNVFAADAAECAEIAALAKLYLQESGIAADYVSGDALWDKGMEFSEEHSMLVVDDGGNRLIYDPTNPTRSGGYTYPSLYQTEVDFDQAIRQGKKQFVTSRNVLTKQEAYFGVSNGANVNPDRDII